MDDILDFKEILVREPFYEVTPVGYRAHPLVYRGQKTTEPKDRLQMRIITQADFLRQFYPSGHKIMDHVLFPDIYKQDPETKKWYMQPVMRTAFAFQKIIYTKQTVHLCGNDVQFELSGKNENVSTDLQNQSDLLDLRQGWLDMGMEEHFYEAVSSVKITGDTAAVGYFDKNGNAKVRVLSYLDGDTLYPHFNSEDGTLELFARKFYDMDENGRTVTEWVEIWDDTYMYRAKRGVGDNRIITKIKDIFGLNGFAVVSQERHGFNFVPVAYHRSRDGACWQPSQNTIEIYEEAVSHFCENNKAYAFPIMYTKGDGVEFHPDDITGAVKYVDIPSSDGDAGFLNRQDVSEAFNTELKNLYDMIYEQSFSVKPPELKSGDLPGVAVKLLFSPAIELAIHDCHQMQHFLDDLVHIVEYSYGLQINRQASLLNIKLNVWIEPYIHQNDTELMTNLAMGVQNGFVSHQTAAERATKYTKNDEIDRIMREDINKRQKDLQDKIDEKRAEVEAEIEKDKAAASGSTNGGQDVNTGKGRNTDENGNWPGENNWDNWNKNH